VSAVATRARPQAGEGSDMLARYASSREPALRNRIVHEHRDLAYHLARRFTGRGEPVEDLVQVAFVGLINAVDRYDPDAGVPLRSFAVPTILGELRRYFRDRAWAMRVPRRVQETYLETKIAVDVLTQELGRSPTYGEIAARLTVTEEAVVEALEAGRNFYALSLDGPESTNVKGTAVVAPHREDRGLNSVEDKELLHTLADNLSRRSRLVVELRFGHDLTQSDIARCLGISQMQVSRILTKALHDMRVRAGSR
jgi:RNA polymerase sigma-B factor